MGYKCVTCEETFNYADEMVFFAGEVEVMVSEASPDYSHAVCIECNDNPEGGE